MEKSSFEHLVLEAIGLIPNEFQDYLSDVDVVIEDSPTKEQLAGNLIKEGQYLLGLYEGVPLTERHEYSRILPDKITLFQESIEAVSSSDDDIVKEVRETVLHEVAHHFGIDDSRLDELGNKERV